MSTTEVDSSPICVGSFTGIHLGRSKQEIVITTPHDASIYNVFEQRRMQGWSFGSNVRLVTSVAQSPATSHCFAATATHLLSWTVDAVSLSKCHERSLGGKSVVGIGSWFAAPPMVVVASDGSLSLISSEPSDAAVEWSFGELLGGSGDDEGVADEATSRTKDSSKKATKKGKAATATGAGAASGGAGASSTSRRGCVVWYHTFESGSECRLAVLSDLTGEGARLSLYKLRGSGSTVDSFNLELSHRLFLAPPDKGDKVAHVSMDDEGLGVSVVWESGTFEVHVVGAASVSSSGAGGDGRGDGPSRPSLSRRLCGFDMSRGLRLTSLSESFVALIGYHPATSVASPLFTVWDTAYGLMHCSRLLKYHNEEPSETANVAVKSDVLGSMSVIDVLTRRLPESELTYVVAATESVVFFCPYFVPPLDLSVAMGKMTLTAPFLDQKGPSSHVGFVNALTLLPAKEGGFTPESWEMSAAAASKADTEAVLALASATSSDVVSQIISNHFQATKAEFSSFIATIPPTASNPYPTNKKHYPNASHHFINTAVAKCLELSLWKPLRLVIETHAVSASANPNLVTLLLESSQWSILEEVFSCVHDLQEAELVRVIRHLAKADTEAQIQGALKNRVKGFFASDTACQMFLCLIVSAPRNDVFLLQALHELTVEEAVFVLEYLKKWLSRYARSPGGKIRNNTRIRIPTLAQVIDWASMVIDAHFTTIIMAPDWHDLVRDLHALVEAQLEVCDAMDSVRGFIDQLMSRTKLPFQSRPDYCVEVIRL